MHQQNSLYTSNCPHVDTLVEYEPCVEQNNGCLLAISCPLDV